MKHTDGIEVYLRPVLDDMGRSHSKYVELPTETALPDTRTNRCFVLATNHEYKVLIHFKKSFKLYTADSVQVVVKFGTGQRQGGFLDPTIIQASWIPDQHQVIGYGGDDETQQTKAMIGMQVGGFQQVNFAQGKDIDEVESTAAADGTITVFIRRGHSEWADGYQWNKNEGREKAHGLGDPGVQRAVQEDSAFKRLRTVNGNAYRFEFKPLHLRRFWMEKQKHDPSATHGVVPEADDYDAELEKVAFVDDTAFNAAGALNKKIRASLTKRWLKSEERKDAAAAALAATIGDAPIVELDDEEREIKPGTTKRSAAPEVRPARPAKKVEIINLISPAGSEAEIKVEPHSPNIADSIRGLSLEADPPLASDEEAEELHDQMELNRLAQEEVQLRMKMRAYQRKKKAQR